MLNTLTLFAGALPFTGVTGLVETGGGREGEGDAAAGAVDDKDAPRLTEALFSASFPRLGLEVLLLASLAPAPRLTRPPPRPPLCLTVARKAGRQT